MKHFIGTRFNVNNHVWKTAKDGSRVLTEEWLAHRFDLFEKYCLPSVLNQKNNNFYWFIFLEKETPASFKNRMSQLIGNYDHIFTVYTEPTSLSKLFAREIGNLLDETDQTVITTRFDNDDAMHRDFVDTIQKLATGTVDAVIDLRKGYQLQITNGYYDCRRYINSFNPFISVVEDSKTFGTVYAKMHKDWKDLDHIISDEKTTLWMEVIHQRNKLNEENLKLDLTTRFELADFGVKEELRFRSANYILSRNFGRRIKRLHIGISKVFKNILPSG